MRFGMSKDLGPLTYGATTTTAPLPASSLGEERNFSERTAQRIDGEARSMLEKIESRVRTTLETKQAALHLMADARVSKETLTRLEIDEILAQEAVLVKG